MEHWNFIFRKNKLIPGENSEIQHVRARPETTTRPLVDKNMKNKGEWPGEIFHRDESRSDFDRSKTILDLWISAISSSDKLSVGTNAFDINTIRR